MVFKNGNWVPQKASGASGEITLEISADGKGKVNSFASTITGLETREGISCYVVGSQKAFYLANDNAYPALTEGDIKPVEKREHKSVQLLKVPGRCGATRQMRKSARN